MTVSGFSSASALTNSASFPAPRYVLYSVLRSVVSSLQSGDETAGAPCQHRCGPHGVRGLERLERLAYDLKARSIRQAPELLQAVSDAQGEPVAVPLALYLDARLSRRSTGTSSTPAKRAYKRQSKQLWATPNKPSPVPAPLVALLHRRPVGRHLCKSSVCTHGSQAVGSASSFKAPRPASE